MIKLQSGYFHLFLVVALAGVFARNIQAAGNAPVTLTQSVTYNNETITLRMTKTPLRGPNFEIKVQNAAGGFDAFAPVGERSYIGTVDEYPAALASGIVKDDGTFWGAVYFDRGETTWYTEGSEVFHAEDFGAPPYAFPEYTVEPGMIGELTYGFDVGIDVRNDFYTDECGSDVATALENIEFSVVTTRALYLQNVQLNPWLGRVIIRSSPEHDPYSGMDKNTFATTLLLEWRNNQQDSNYDMVAGTDTIGGGTARPEATANSSTASIGHGFFGKVWRHELAHSWGLGHYDGGSPEGETINSGNKYSRMSGPEVYKILRRRNHDERHKAMIESEGVYTAIDIPPYAALDQTVLAIGTTQAVVDVMANDHDINDTAGLVIRSFEAASHQGGTVALVGSGTGAALEYTAPTNGFTGTDWFHYEIEDSSGQTATGVAMVDIAAPSVATVSTFAGGNLQNAANWDNGLPSNVVGIINVDGTGVQNWNVSSLGAATFHHTGGELTGGNHQLKSSAGLLTWNMDGGTVVVDGGFSVNDATVNLLSGAISAATLRATSGGWFEMTGGTYTANGLNTQPGIAISNEGSTHRLMGGTTDLLNATENAFKFDSTAIDPLLHIGGGFTASVAGTADFIVREGEANTFIDPDWTGSISRDGYTADDWMEDLTNANTFVGAELGTTYTNIPVWDSKGYINNKLFEVTSVLGGTLVTAENFTNLFAVANAGAAGSSLSRIANNDPVFSVPATAGNATQDTTYAESIAGSAIDSDDDPLTYTKLDGPAWLAIAPDGTLSGTPGNDDVPTVNRFTVSVEDGRGGVDTTTLEITVVNVNDAPVFVFDPVIACGAPIGLPYVASIAGSATDPDVGDTLAYSSTNSPPWLSVASNGVLSGTPPDGDLGTSSFTLLVEDGNGGTDSADISITVRNRRFLGGDLTDPANWEGGLPTNATAIVDVDSTSGNWPVSSLGAFTINHTGGTHTGNFNLYGNPDGVWIQDGGHMDISTAYFANGMSVHLAAGTVQTLQAKASNGGTFTMTAGSLTSEKTGATGYGMGVVRNSSSMILLGGSADLTAGGLGFQIGDVATQTDVLLRIGGTFTATLANGADLLAFNADPANSGLVIETNWTGSITCGNYTAADWQAELIEGNATVDGTVITAQNFSSYFVVDFEGNADSRLRLIYGLVADPIGDIGIGNSAGAGMVLSWDSSAGQIYDVQTNESLASPNWGIFDTIVGNGGGVVVTASVDQATLFYKVTTD